MVIIEIIFSNSEENYLADIILRAESLRKRNKTQDFKLESGTVIFLVERGEKD